MLEIFNHWEGVWGLERDVTGGIRMSGTATFERITPNLLHYREKGSMMRQDTASEFYRDYRYEWRSDAITVLFMDGRLFHTLDFSGKNSAACLHHCGDDVYSGQYLFQPPGFFTLAWNVRGPRKDYDIFTRYTRLET